MSLCNGLTSELLVLVSANGVPLIRGFPSLSLGQALRIAGTTANRSYNRVDDSPFDIALRFDHNLHLHSRRIQEQQDTQLSGLRNWNARHSYHIYICWNTACFDTFSFPSHELALETHATVLVFSS